MSTAATDPGQRRDPTLRLSEIIAGGGFPTSAPSEADADKPDRDVGACPLFEHHPGDFELSINGQESKLEINARTKVVCPDRLRLEDWEWGQRTTVEIQHDLA